MKEEWDHFEKWKTRFLGSWIALKRTGWRLMGSDWMSGLGDECDGRKCP